MIVQDSETHVKDIMDVQSNFNEKTVLVISIITINYIGKIL